MAAFPSPLRHPIAFVREKWVGRAETDVLDDDEMYDGPERRTDDRPDPEMVALVDRLHEDPSVCGITFDSATPNEVEVFLEPWSETSAQWVRDVCSPRTARLVAGLPPWLDELDQD